MQGSGMGRSGMQGGNMGYGGMQGGNMRRGGMSGGNHAIIRELESDLWIERNIPGGLNSARGEYLDNMYGGNPNPTWGQVAGGYPGVGGNFGIGGFEGMGNYGGYGAGYGYSYGGY
ncbi:unnamed protein product [Rotaria sp. Silwood2]|nr:unnamed protein product [Rotaria sp. Silwood2]CAF3313700.1 unnamed protein product [Rotaria sp. Silwood2]CAF3326765.1 unnamed protein product [Rotaria sp. Silwood2]CAF4108884.1 unnamed protein product [Rotaria sp. Silwood2]CAF4134264.1 unnamed protein product [Rotaria sp. Silwood2]